MAYHAKYPFWALNALFEFIKVNITIKFIDIQYLI